MIPYRQFEFLSPFETERLQPISSAIAAMPCRGQRQGASATASPRRLIFIAQGLAASRTLAARDMRRRFVASMASQASASVGRSLTSARSPPQAGIVLRKRSADQECSWPSLSSSRFPPPRTRRRRSGVGIATTSRPQRMPRRSTKCWRKFPRWRSTSWQTITRRRTWPG